MFYVACFLKYMSTKIRVIGLGGAGCNTCSRIYSCKIEGVEVVAANTDLQDLKNAKAHKKIQLGKELTKGLGSGMNPEIGREAAAQGRRDLEKALQGTDMLFMTCGMGGGTGSGAAPVLAEIAKSMGILTLAFVTQPFSFEGAERKRIAERGISELQNKVDTLLVISNDKIFEICDRGTSLKDAFWKIDEFLRQAIQGISDLIVQPGFINVDFSDVRTIMRHGGQAMFGTGIASGEDRARRAAEAALSSPLLDFSIEGSRGILLNVAASEDLALAEVEEAAKTITSKVDPRAKIIFGAVKDNQLKKGEVKVTVIATKFQQ